MPMPWAGMCRTMNTAAGRSVGSAARICFKGAVAPAEPPITMMSRLLIREPAVSSFVDTKAAVCRMFQSPGALEETREASPTLLRERAPLSGRRILVVEDEYFLADDIGCMLRALGADVAG